MTQNSNIEYYYRSYQYNIKLYYLDNKWIIERKDYQETYKVAFKSIETAQEFLDKKNYKIYQILVKN